MTFSPPITVCTLILFLLIAVVPPRLPLVARLAIQMVLGLGIYFGLKEAEFLLPNGDNLAMSSLFGGDGGMGEFNKYAMGVLGPALGIVLSLVAAAIRKVTSKGDSQ